MKKIMTIIGFLALFPVGAALAEDDCFVPMADWQPREAVARLAQENGWTVRRIKVDDGCYEIDGSDAEVLVCLFDLGHLLTDVHVDGESVG